MPGDFTRQQIKPLNSWQTPQLSFACCFLEQRIREPFVSHWPVHLHRPLMSHLNFQMSQWKQLPLKKKKENPTQNFPVSQRIVSLYFLERFSECAFQVIDRPMSDTSLGGKKSIKKPLKCSLTVILPLNKYFYHDQASNAKCHFPSARWGLLNFLLLRKLEQQL